MFESFSDHARRVVVVAQDEAHGLEHDHIGAEHLLLGLIRGKGDAAKALDTLGVSFQQAHKRVGELVGHGGKPVAGSIPFSDTALDVFDGATREARRRGHDRVGTGDLLLGLIADGDGVATQALISSGVAPDRVREALHSKAAGAPGSGAMARSAGSPDARTTGRARAHQTLEDLLSDFDRAEREVARLRGLLRQHGINPDDPVT